MPNPWDIPYAHKLKTGDAAEDTIFSAVGRALTKWEGLEAAIASLFTVLMGATDRQHYVPSVRAFGATMSSVVRADMITHAADAFFYRFDRAGFYDEMKPYEAELNDILKAYRGWLARRNDVAHGYVTGMQHPNYWDQGPALITTYLLLPSHSISRKWPLDWEPVYKYRAAEIEKFAAEFEALDKAVMDYSARLDQWQKATLAKLALQSPPQSPG